jgi:hypothetical protein
LKIDLVFYCGRSFLLLFLFAGSALFAQTGIPDEAFDTGESLGVDEISSSGASSDSLFYIGDARIDYFESIAPFLYLPLDTLLDDFDEHDPVRLSDPERQTNAVLGGASQSLRLDDRLQFNVGQELGINAWSPYMQKASAARWWRANKPFTQARYVLGSGVEQRLDVRHVRNFFPNLNFSVDYTRYVAEGLNASQKSGVHDLAISSWFQSPGRKYNAWLFYGNAIANAEENGGTTLPGDSVFNFTPRDAAPVNLSNAFHENRFQQIQINQSWAWGDVEEIKINDSTSRSRLIPKVLLMHEFLWSNDRRSYTDPNPDTSFYPSAVVADTLDTLFSAWSRKRIENALVFRNNLRKEYAGLVEQSRWDWGMRLAHQYDRFAGQVGDSSLHNAYVQAWYRSNDLGGANWQTADFGLQADVRGELQLNAFAGLKLYPWIFKLGAAYQRNRPTFQQLDFSNTYFFWSEDFNTVQRLQPQIEFAQKDWDTRIRVSWNSVNNFIYWDSLAQPLQLSSGMSYWSLEFSQNFQLGNWHLDNTGYLQIVDENFVHVPLWFGRHQLYYEGYFFKEAMFAQVGMELRYSSQYLSDLWSPVTQTYFYSETAQTKRYPIVDAYFSARVKKARIFLKGFNLLQGLLEPGFFQTAGYAMPDRGIRLGIDWEFYY